MSEKEEWSEIETPNEEQKIEIEIEKEEEEEVQETKSEEGKRDTNAEKRIAQLIRQRRERDQQITALIQKNEVLSGSLRTKDNEVHQVNKLSLDASEKQLLLKAQEMLNEAQADLKAVSSAKLDYEEVEEVAPVQPQYRPPPPQPTTDPRAEEWASRNSWFGQDNIKTAAALAIDAELKEEGFNPSDNDFYQEIDNRINKAFSQNTEETKERVQEMSSTPAQVVSGSSRSSPSSASKVKLSREDVRLAQKWNIPLEQYAAEKLKVDGADGNYTNIT